MRFDLNGASQVRRDAGVDRCHRTGWGKDNERKIGSQDGSDYCVREIDEAAYDSGFYEDFDEEDFNEDMVRESASHYNAWREAEDKLWLDRRVRTWDEDAKRRLPYVGVQVELTDNFYRNGTVEKEAYMFGTN